MFTKAEYNHASICIYDDFREFYSFGRHLIWFPIISGFVTERVNCGMYKYFSETRCVIYSIDVSKTLSDRLEQNLDAFRKNPFIYRYNFKGLLGILLNRPMGSKHHYFCSQFVASVIQDSGIYEFSKNSKLVTPEDFHEIPGLVKVYEGRLSDLPCFEMAARGAAFTNALPV
jgi:hypothetical protein